FLPGCAFWDCVAEHRNRFLRQCNPRHSDWLKSIDTPESHCCCDRAKTGPFSGHIWHRAIDSPLAGRQNRGRHCPHRDMSRTSSPDLLADAVMDVAGQVERGGRHPDVPHAVERPVAVTKAVSENGVKVPSTAVDPSLVPGRCDREVGETPTSIGGVGSG